MKALYVKKDQIQLLNTIPRPTPPVNELLIRTRMAGICRTDLELSKGYMGFEGIPGHEFTGEIVESTGKLKPGTRVTGEINAGCGQCEYCHKGLERHCPHRSTLGIFQRDGCMAEFLTLPEKNLFPIPDSLPDEHAVFAEPLAAALEIFEQILIQPADRVCILGDGKLGLLIAMVFGHRHEGETVLIGHHADKLSLVHDFVTTHLEKDIPGAFPKSWDIVIEATGTTSGLRQSMNLIRPRGTIVLKSTMAHAGSIDLTPLVIDEIHLLGSRCGRFTPAINLLTRGVIPTERLIDAVYPFGQALEAWDAAARPGAKKILLQIHEEC